MRNICCLLPLFLTGFSFASFAQSGHNTDSTDSLSEKFLRVEKTAQFPGGMGKFYQYISKSISYPENAKRNKIEGKVYVAFVINADGSIEKSSVQAMEENEMLPNMPSATFHPELQQEAVRLLRGCPNWKPALIDNKPTRQKLIVPIAFKL